MTMKLMKYELKSMLRTFVPLWCAILILSILNRFTLRIDVLSDLLGGVPAVLLLIAYILGTLAVLVITVVVLILRFYNGLLKDEGYLMFTLPVKAWQLLCSKLFSAVILTLSTTAVSILSILVLVIDNAVAREIGDLAQVIITYSPLQLDAKFFTTIILMAIAAVILSAFSQTLQFYLSMALGQLANRGKAGFSVLSYIGTSLLVSLVTNLAFTTPMIVKLETLQETVLYSPATITLMLNVFGTALILQALLAVAFYVPTWWILKNKLNLE